MSSMLLTGHYYCVSCEEVIPDVSLCSKHYFECHSPNILRIRLVAAPSMESQRSSIHKSKTRNKNRRDNASTNISQARETTPPPPNSRNAPNSSTQNDSNVVRNSAANINNMYEAAPIIRNVPYSSRKTSIRSSTANISNMK
ncbi:hypothetical protein OnM2_105024 [Erysiphe neolycopersici]|uniref:Uncharacterized protein n=1 Tax=Erysiphe neolycopersici TaxID=212602 RepID=A0A420H7T2_9PEZI|nr:hypothetical protein OnM2_105024 [Erysiphe neolycopersici]